MQKISDLFYRFSQGLTLGIGGCLVMMSSLAMIVYGVMYSNHHYGIMTAAMLLMAGVTAVVILALSRLMERSNRRTAVVLMVLLVLCQIFFLLFISHPMAISDPARVQNEALMMVQRQHGQMNMQDAYFQRYPNNHFIVVLFYYFYKILFFFGIQKIWIPMVLLNMAAIDAGIYFSWRIAACWKGVSAANLLLCLFILCPTTYVWLTTVYTNTISFPFVMGILWLCLKLQEESRKTGMWAALGAVMAVGYWVRPTTIIPIIAVILYFLSCIWQEGKEHYSRKHMIRPLIAVAVFLCCFAGCRSLVNRHMDRSRLTGAFPVTHWIMMGLNTDTFGEFSREDEAYTMSFSTKNEKRQADIKRIRERVTELGMTGIAYQAAAKMFGVWALADDDCFAKAEYASDFPEWYRYFMGKDNTWYLLFMQGLRVLTFLFLLWSVVGQMHQKKCDEAFLFSLTFVGAVLFFVLWEANRKYNVCFMGVCMLLMADGICRCVQFLQKPEFSGILTWKRLFGTVTALFICCVSLTSYVQTEITPKAVSAQANVVYHCRNNPDSVAVSDMSRKEKKNIKKPVLLKQTIHQGQLVKKGDKEKIILNFERNRTKELKKKGKGKKRNQSKMEFRKLKRKVTKLQKKKEYKIEVLSLESRQKIYSRMVRNDQFSKSGKLVLNLPKITRDTSRGYVIRLRHYGKMYTMIPKVSRFPDLDPYPYGGLYMNGRKTNYDLSMSILQKQNET